MKCRAVCGNNTSNFVSRNLYGDIQNGHPEKSLSIKLGEIIDQNPNSRELITLVFKDLCQQGGLRTVKKQIRIGLDGVPYRIACDVKEKSLKYPKCNVEIDEANTSLEFHLSEMHTYLNHRKVMFKRRKSIQERSTSVRSGHMEKYLLAIFLLCQRIFLEHLVDLLGFRTKNSREFIMNCRNQYVTW